MGMEDYLDFRISRQPVPDFLEPICLTPGQLSGYVSPEGPLLSRWLDRRIRYQLLTAPSTWKTARLDRSHRAIALRSMNVTHEQRAAPGTITPLSAKLEFRTSPLGSCSIRVLS